MVQAITAAVLAGLSDLIAQKLAAKAPVNWRRTAAMAAFGGVYSGPSNHLWQARAVRVFGCRGATAKLTLKLLLQHVQAFVERVFRGRSGPTLLIQKVHPNAVATLACCLLSCALPSAAPCVYLPGIADGSVRGLRRLLWTSSPTVRPLLLLIAAAAARKHYLRCSYIRAHAVLCAWAAAGAEGLLCSQGRSATCCSCPMWPWSLKARAWTLAFHRRLGEQDCVHSDHLWDESKGCAHSGHVRDESQGSSAAHKKHLAGVCAP